MIELNEKILYIATVAKKHICQFHIPYLRWFQEQGYEVHIAAHDDFEDGDRKDIPHCDKFFNIPFSRSPFSTDNLRAYGQLKKIISDNGYSLIHFHTPVAAAVGRLAARKSNAVVLYTTHGFHFYQNCPKSGELYHLVEKFLIPYTNGIITINQEDYRSAQKMCKGTDCSVYFMHGMGVDTNKFAQFYGNNAEIKRKFGIPEDAFVLLSVSEINANKNLKTTIQAFAKARSDNMYYLICGTGDQLENCKRLAEKLGIEDRVIFAGYRYDIHEIVHIADVFMFPSLREGLGVAPIEAMSAAVPIIASDIRGVQEYAVHRKNSILLQPEDIDGFADAIRVLYENESFRLELGRNAALSVAPFDLRESIEAMSEIYSKYIKIKTAVKV